VQKQGGRTRVEHLLELCTDESSDLIVRCLQCVTAYMIYTLARGQDLEIALVAYMD